MKVPEKTNDGSINIALDTVAKKKQALVFNSTKRSAEKTGEDIAKKMAGGNPKLLQLSEEVLHALARPTKQCQRLSACVKKGIAFHHAGLTQKQKDIVEDSFRSGLIRVISCTPTLAAGLDLPAFRTVLKSLKRYGPRGLQYIPVLEYLQMAGRAGRPNYDSFGEAIIIASSEPEKEDVTERFVKGSPEEIYSKLAVEPVLRTYLLSLISINFVNSRQSIVSFFEKTFWAFQFRDMARLESIIEKMLGLLDEWEFIRRSGDDFRPADELGDEMIKATQLGKRVSELYIDPLTAHFIITCLHRASSVMVNPFSILQMISHTLEMRPLLKVRAKEYDVVEEALAKHEILELEPTMYDMEYDEFLNSVKTALFFNDWIDECDEETLLDKYNIRPGEIRTKLDTADWMLYASDELCRMLRFQKVIKEIRRVRLRLKYGVKEELLTLLRLEQVGRVRARKLYRNGIKDISDVKSCDIQTLVQILGRSVAVNIKKQVGQDFGKVKQGKRKGQISLLDY
ncbi:MAG: helicase-related protein [archaeon]